MIHKFVITAAEVGASPNHKQLDAYENYASQNDAEIIVIPILGQYPLEDLHKRFNDYTVATEYDFCSNLEIKDFGVKAQNINPLTGLKRFGAVNKSIIVGEDLGTVPPYVRPAMKRHNLHQMYVVHYELASDSKKGLRSIPRNSVVSLNTHDMPPFAAFWQGLDIDLRRRIGLLDKAGVAVTPGVGYGNTGEGYIRLSLTLPDDHLEEGVKRLLSWRNRVKIG